MKIAQFTMFYHPIRGGQETYIENLLKVFKRNSNKSTIYQPYRKGNKPKGIQYIPSLPLVGRLIPDARWFVYNLFLYLLCKSFKDFDIAISHYAFHLPAIEGIRHKTIILSHGVDWHEPAKTTADKWRKESALKLTRSRKGVIVANDTHFLRSIGIHTQPRTNYFKQLAKNVWFIPNCICTDSFCPDERVQRDKTILVPRNIRFERGIHLAIESFNAFNQEHPGHKLKIAGGPLKGQYYTECKEQVNELGLTKEVEFLGPTNWERMKDLYRTSTVTLIPTIELEGTSLSALESMACKTPVVATNVGGLNDLPCLIAKKDPIDISSKLRHVINNYDNTREQQYEATIQTFNMDNWERAWNQATESLQSTLKHNSATI